MLRCQPWQLRALPGSLGSQFGGHSMHLQKLRISERKIGPDRRS